MGYIVFYNTTKITPKSFYFATVKATVYSAEPKQCPLLYSIIVPVSRHMKAW